MEIRNIIKNNKTGEIISDEIMEISDDELAEVSGGIRRRVCKDESGNENARFSPTSDNRFTSTK